MDTDLPQSQNLFQDKEPTLFNSPLILFFVAITLFMALLYRLNDLSLLALLVLITMGGAKLWSVMSLGRVTCKTEADRKRVFAGETLSMTTTVANQKFLPVWVRLQWPNSHMIVVKEKAKSSTWEAGILWYQQAYFLQTLAARRRGVYTAGPSRMQTSDLFGFFRAERKLDQANTIIVYPKLVDIKMMDLTRCDLFGKPGSQIRSRDHHKKDNIALMPQGEKPGKKQRGYFPALISPAAKNQHHQAGNPQNLKVNIGSILKGNRHPFRYFTRQA